MDGQAAREKPQQSAESELSPHLESGENFSFLIRQDEWENFMNHLAVQLYSAIIIIVTSGDTQWLPTWRNWQTH